jgi:beta-lactamase class A
MATTAAMILAAALQAATLDTTGLERDLTALAQQFRGRIGACVQTTHQSTCVHAQDRFPLQSVMKLLVAFGVMDQSTPKAGGWTRQCSSAGRISVSTCSRWRSW